MNLCRRTALKGIAVLLSAAAATACTTTGAPYAAGMQTVDLDIRAKGPVAGVGIESRDIVSSTDRIVREMLTVPELGMAAYPARVIVDGTYFYNESAQRLDKNLITDRLRVSLNQAARGRMVFVGRHYSRMVAEERELKRAGVVDAGTLPTAAAQAGADYRLGGRISSQHMRSPSTGLIQRYTQITFEMVNLETGVIVWSGIHELARASADDIVYR